MLAKNKAFYLVFFGLILLHLVLFNAQRLYPFADLPHHLAEATIYRYAGQGDNQLAHYYPFDLAPYANAFHILFMANPLFASVEIGAKIFHSIYLLLLPLSIWLLIRELEGDIWFSLMAFLYLYNYDFCWGLSAFSFFLPLFFVFWAVLIKYKKSNKIRHNIALILLLGFIYHVHIMGFFFVGAVLLLAVLFFDRDSFKRPGMKVIFVLPFLGGAGIALMNAVAVKRVGSYLLRYYADMTVLNFPSRMREFLLFDNLILFGGRKGELVAAVFSFFVIGLIIQRLYQAYQHRTFRQSLGFGKYLYPVLVCALLCFFLLPHKIPGHGSPYQRFSSLFFLGLIVLGALLKPRSSKGLKITICVLVSIHFLLWGYFLTDFNRQNRGFTRDFFPVAQPGKVLTGMIFDKIYRRFPVYIHFPDFYIVWRKGIAATAMQKYGYVIFDNNLARRPLPAYDEWLSASSNLIPEDFAADLLLVRGIPSAKFRRFVDRHFRLLRAAGQWLLYERKPFKLTPVP